MSAARSEKQGVHPSASEVALVADDVLQERLQQWGAWLAAGGRPVSGFPTKSVLHQSWMPPSQGVLHSRVVRTVSDRRERELHRCIGRLSVKLSNALIVVFVHRVPPDEQAVRLGCQQATVRARIAHARSRLRVMLAQADGHAEI